jgi:hypothetical protein
VEPEGSLPHSQVPATCPFAESDHSSLCFPIPRLEAPCDVILPSTHTCSKCCFHQVSPPKPCVHLTCHPSVPHVPPISFFRLHHNFSQWPTWCTNFNTFITILYMYMFRAIPCSSSGCQIVLIQHLVSSLSVSDDTRCCINTIWPPEDEQDIARNM